MSSVGGPEHVMASELEKDIGHYEGIPRESYPLERVTRKRSTAARLRSIALEIRPVRRTLLGCG